MVNQQRKLYNTSGHVRKCLERWDEGDSPKTGEGEGDDPGSKADASEMSERAQDDGTYWIGTRAQALRANDGRELTREGLRSATWAGQWTHLTKRLPNLSRAFQMQGT